MRDDDRVRRYVCEAVTDRTVASIRSVSRFEAGDRHAVFRVGYVDAAGATGDLVVRVSLTDDAAERAQAEREAVVLSALDGMSSPRLVDFRVHSMWFEAPVLCLEFVQGQPRELSTVTEAEVERLGAVVAAVHDLAVDDRVERFPGVRTLEPYVGERLAQIAAYRPRLRPPPPPVGAQLDAAFSSVNASLEGLRRSESYVAEERLVILHGDIGAGNILWTTGRPVLIDWEYARLGDPADDVGYVFAEQDVDPGRRQAFWAGYRSASGHPRVDHLAERARWWEPLNLLGSALWWLERWSRRVDADAAGRVAPSAPRAASYYFGHAIRLLDRVHSASDPSSWAQD